MNKMLHAVVLVFFASACWFLSLMLKLPAMAAGPSGAGMPAFTRLGMSCGPYLTAGLALLALAYCIYIWTRKADHRANWIGFLATALSALFVVLLPTIVAMYITVVDVINRSGVH